MRKNYLNLAKSQERKNIKNNKEIFGREIDSIAEALNLEEELLTGYYVWYKLENKSSIVNIDTKENSTYLY